MAPLVGTGVMAMVLLGSRLGGLMVTPTTSVVAMISAISAVGLISGSLAVGWVLLRHQPGLVAIAGAMAAASTVLITTVLSQGTSLNPLILGVPDLGWAIVPTMIFRAIEYGILGWLLARLLPQPWTFCALLGVGVGMCLGSGFLLATLLRELPSLGVLVGVSCHEMLLPMGCAAVLGGATRPRRRRLGSA